MEINKFGKSYLKMIDNVSKGRACYFSPFGYSFLIVLGEILVLLALVLYSKNKLFQDPLYKWFLGESK